MGFHFNNGMWWCEDVAIDILADHYGTPLYVYSRAQLGANYQRVAEAFAPLNARLHFSVKSNANGEILRILRDLGAGFDVVSGGELFRALHAGADPATIVFAGVGKTQAELVYAIDQGVGWINVESVQELEVLEEIATTRSIHSSIALRVNPSVEADTHHHIATGGHRSKFGIDVDEAHSILENADHYSHLNHRGIAHPYRIATRHARWDRCGDRAHFAAHRSSSDPPARSGRRFSRRVSPHRSVSRTRRIRRETYPSAERSIVPDRD